MGQFYAGVDTISIIGHTNDDVELRLRDNLEGLDWLVPQLSGQPAGAKPLPRLPLLPKTAASSQASAVKK